MSGLVGSLPCCSCARQPLIHDPSERHRTAQLEILYAITKPDDKPFGWSMEELGRELSDHEIEPAIVTCSAPDSSTAPQTTYAAVSSAAIRLSHRQWCP
jgi:hypothetical protein